MNWEIIRITIDVVSVIMFIIIGIVFYVAQKAYKKTMQPITTMSSMLGGMVASTEEPIHDTD